MASAFTETIAEHGPESVALYVSGQFLTEDYYVANKLMKGFIGSPISTPIRACAWPRRSPAITAPSARTWCPAATRIWRGGPRRSGRLQHGLVPSGALSAPRAARGRRGTKIVVIDPRRTVTCDIADLHLAIRPGSDVALFEGLLAHLARTAPATRAWIA